MWSVQLIWIVILGLVQLQVSADCNSVSSGDSSVYPVQYTTTYSGTATYYGTYTNGGACTLDPTPFDAVNGEFATVAIATNIWAGSKACGMCINMTASGKGSGASPMKGNYLLYVNNDCPSCGSSGIDVGLDGDGAWDITWKAVPCPVGSSSIQFLLQGSNSYYIKLQVRNTRYPVYSVSVLQNGAYHALVRTADNFFTAGSSVTFPLSFPLTVKVTSADGDSVVDSVPSLTNGAVMTGTTQFLDCSGSSSSPSGTTTAKAATSSAAISSAATSSAATSSAAASTSKSATSAAVPVSTTSGTSSGTSTTGSSVSRTYIYQDSLSSAFGDWSWATVVAQSTTKVYAGTYSYQFDSNDYQGVYFECQGSTTCINSATYSALEFYMNPSFPIDATNKQVIFEFSVGTSIVISNGIATYTGSTLAAGVWTKVVVPITGSYDGIRFQSNSASDQGLVYLDNLALLGK